MKATVHNEQELQALFAAHPDKIIGLTAGFGACYATIYTRWADVPHDTHRMGIFRNGKPVSPPRHWRRAENLILNAND